MKNPSPKIECPECGCKEIHMEYDSYVHNLISRASGLAEEGIPAKPIWYQCMGCGVIFDPIKEASAI
ncbi:MAG: hypothetical protein LBQ60_06870 [Bacteroidales bacterium]|jgi:DNA-directed RNA polymerase subunit RPC12/RpoP|nr:hypothetical protein [Bacteroidales bacterium]